MAYQAGAFGSQFADGRSSGRLEILGQSLRFVARSGEDIRFPVAGLELRFGGANDRLIFVGHKNHPGLSLHISDRSFLSEDILRNHPALETLRLQAQGRRRRTLIGVGLLLAVPVMLVASLIFGWSKITSALAASVPVSIEEQLGAAAVSELGDSATCEGDAVDALRALAQPLLDAAASERYSFTFCVASDDMVNAFAAPGGTVVVMRGLVDQAATTDELLGVLAHEISHVTAQHGTRSVINTLGWLAGLQLLFGDAGGAFGLLVQAAPMLIHLQYSQSFESEADALAVALLAEAGIDPRGLVRFFATLKQEEEASGIEVPQLLSTHPATDDRIAALNDLIDRTVAGNGWRDPGLDRLRNELNLLYEGVEQ